MTPPEVVMAPPYAAPTVTSITQATCTLDTPQTIPGGHFWGISFEARLVGGRDWQYEETFDGGITGWFRAALESSPITPSPYAPSTTTTTGGPRYVISSVEIRTPVSAAPVTVPVDPPVTVQCPPA
jgi:hypothetical protein